ncbi:hypothetical protein Gotur_013686, partial [Gossypium turneri]
MIAVQVGAATRNGVTYIHPGPYGPHSGCHPNPKSSPTQANTYNHCYSRHRS